MHESKHNTHFDITVDYHRIAEKSGYNNQISIWERNDGQRLVMRQVNEGGESNAHVYELTPFLFPNKLQKESILLAFLESNGLPIARLVQYNPPSVSIYEWASGEELDFQEIAQGAHDTRIAVGKNLGAYLGAFHSSQTGDSRVMLLDQIPGTYGFTTPKEKHVWRLEESIDYLREHSVLTSSEAVRLKQIGHEQIQRIPDTEFCIIHGDFYSRNIFIDSTNLDITAVIDWIDASEADDPLADLLLSARWYAFKDDLSDVDIPENIAAFYSIIQGYLEKTNTYLECDPLQTYKIYDILWHLRVLVAEQSKGNTQTVHQFKKTLYTLLEMMTK